MPVVNESLTMQDKMQAISICGHEVITPEIHRIAKHRNGIASGSQKLSQIFDIVKVISLSRSTNSAGFSFSLGVTVSTVG